MKRGPMMKGDRKWLHERVRAQGFRLTFPRQAIVDMLEKVQGHISADEIYVKVHKKYPGVGLTTVYRTLELLAHMGVLSKYEFGDGRARYELCNKNIRHHHLICRGCGRVIDYDECAGEETKLMSKIEEKLSKKYSFKIDSHQLRFYGVCSKCKTR